MNHLDVEGLLRARGIRPTRHRVALAELLLVGPPRHVTAEWVHRELSSRGDRMSLATVYNTLNQLKGAGLLSEVVVGPGRAWFDTRVDPHHHLFDETTGELFDASPGLVSEPAVGDLPAGIELVGVDVVVRVRRAGPPEG